MIWSDEKEEIEKLRDQLKKYRDWKLIEVREPGFSSKKVYWVEYDSTVVMEVRDGRMRVRTEYAPDREFKEVFRLVQHAFACEIDLKSLTFEEAFEAAGFRGEMINVVEKLRELKCEIQEDANHHVWLVPRGNGALKDWLVVIDHSNHQYQVVRVYYEMSEGDVLLDALHWYGGEVQLKDFSIRVLTKEHREAVLVIEQKTEDKFPVAQYLDKGEGIVRGIFWHGYLVGYCTVGEAVATSENDFYGFEPDAKVLDNLVVDPDWQDLGIGSRLVHSVLAKEELVYCCPDCACVARFCEQLGFTKVGDWLLRHEQIGELNSFSDEADLGKVFDEERALKAQEEYCKQHNLPMFASERCPWCHGKVFAHISVGKASSELITGCPVCGYTFCD